MKQFFYFLIAALIIIFLAVGCSEPNETGLSYNKPVYPVIPDDIIYAVIPDTSEDTYFQDCIECKFYFCPPLDAVWQKEICFDMCEEPPTLYYEGACEEHLECDPTNPIIEADIPCVTEDGHPGLQDKICSKGKIFFTDCESDCEEEVCNGADDDCDGDIDEGIPR